jgi:hypothetical protein
LDAERGFVLTWKTLTLVVIITSIATTGYPCSVTRIPSAAELVTEAEAIVLMRAEGLATQKGRPGPFAGSDTQVRFRVVEILKGTIPAEIIEFNGALTEQDDRNDGPVPYDFIRPGGRHGNCVALEYRRGADYLLLLKRSLNHGATPDTLTPYWAALAPTNEQVFGSGDPWLAWVRKTVAELHK